MFRVYCIVTSLYDIFFWGCACKYFDFKRATVFCSDTACQSTKLQDILEIWTEHDHLATPVVTRKE